MNEEIKLKLQAHLDGELSAREARDVSELLSNDGDAQSLFAEIQFTKTALRGNEMEMKLPESREFYWSKIQREIGRQTNKPLRTSSESWWKPAYVRFATVLAAGCALLVISFLAFNAGSPVSFPGEIESTGEEMGAITYHSNADGMTVVYLVDREQGGVIDSPRN